jgi:hypothetical protein
VKQVATGALKAIEQRQWLRDHHGWENVRERVPDPFLQMILMLVLADFR